MLEYLRTLRKHIIIFTVLSLLSQVTMKLKVADNGNVVAIRQDSADLNFDNRSWLSNNTDSRNSYNSRYNISQFNSNFNFYDSGDSSDFLKSTDARIEAFNRDSNNHIVCNRQYRINAENSGLFLNSLNNQQTTNLEGSTDTTFSTRESFLGEFLIYYFVCHVGRIKLSLQGLNCLPP